MNCDCYDNSFLFLVFFRCVFVACSTRCTSIQPYNRDLLGGGYTTASEVRVGRGLQLEIFWAKKNGRLLCGGYLSSTFACASLSFLHFKLILWSG